MKRSHFHINEFCCLLVLRISTSFDVAQILSIWCRVVVVVVVVVTLYLACLRTLMDVLVFTQLVYTHPTPVSYISEKLDGGA